MSEFNKRNIDLALQGDALGCLSWHVGLSPYEMEEWAKLSEGPDSPMRAFVRRVNDPDFLPESEMWRKIHKGLPYNMWVVGKEGTRVIRVNYNLTFMPEDAADDLAGIKRRFEEVLKDLAPDELDVTTDGFSIKVRMWWD